MKLFRLENNKIIYILDDDFQVCSSVMEAYSIMNRGIEEMKNRGMLEAVSHISKFNRYYIETFKDEPDKIARFCYNELLRLLSTGKGEEL